MNWQPIKTAPKDTPILVSDGTYVVAATIDTEPLGPERRLWVRSYGFWGYEWDWEFMDNELTHWATLPEPPKEDGK